jgi:HPt (histidine-containing phosphotransfer) domain-containing protein
MNFYSFYSSAEVYNQYKLDYDPVADCVVSHPGKLLETVMELLCKSLEVHPVFYVENSQYYTETIPILESLLSHLGVKAEFKLLNSTSTSVEFQKSEGTTAVGSRLNSDWPVFSLEKALNSADGDEAFLLELLEDFSQLFERLVSCFSADVSSPFSEKIRSVHSVKGSAYMLGMVALAKTAEWVEERMKNEDYEEENYLSALKEQYFAVENELSQQGLWLES